MLNGLLDSFSNVPDPRCVGRTRWDGGDFIGFAIDCQLAKTQTLLAGKGTHNMQGPTLGGAIESCIAMEVLHTYRRNTT